MTFIVTRLCCALLSAVGAAGLVAFANPANGLSTAQAAPHAAVLVAAAPVAAAPRG